MKIEFRPLFTLGVDHTYYGGACRDFRYLVPASAGATLRRGRLLAREQDGVLAVLYAADDTGAPVADVTGSTLRVGLQLANRYFSNFTALPAGFPTLRARWSNAAAATALQPASGVHLAGQPLVHPLSTSAGPATVTLYDESGDALQSQTLAAGERRETVSFEVLGYAPGAYRVVESAAGGSTSTWYLLDEELARGDPAGVVDITIAQEFYADPPDLRVAFTARQQTLRYYVLARNYSVADVDQLTVSDQGAAVDGRPAIAFDKVAPASFGSEELTPSLAGAGERLVLFRSHSAVARQEQGRHRIQLSKNGDVLIANLPQPGADRSAADLIVHLSKP